MTAAAVARRLAAPAAALLLAGCAAGLSPPPRPSPALLTPGSPLLSRTLSDGDAWLRHYLATGDYDRALELIQRSKSLPGDKLLRHLQAGVVLHAARRYGESNRAFAWAEDVAERRYTASLTSAAGAMLLNDRIIRYTPSRTELGAIAYYRMLNYLALDDAASAAVEARKASALMMRREAGNLELRCAGDGFLQYLSGLVFAAAGEENDALVSLRHAERAFDACDDSEQVRVPATLAADLAATATALGVAEVASAAAERYGLPLADSAPAADLVVLVEHGFVSHRAQEDLYIPLLEDDQAYLLDSGDHSLLAGRITARLWGDPAHPAAGIQASDIPLAYWAHGGEIAHLLKLAWPVMREEASRPARVEVLIDGVPAAATPTYNASRLVSADLKAERVAATARLIARSLLKYAVAQAAEGKAEDEGGKVAGFLVGLVTNTAANALERADTRSWTLLPDRVSLVRFRLPPGEHRVQLAVDPGFAGEPEVVDLGVVSLAAGKTAFLSRRVWGAVADSNPHYWPDIAPVNGISVRN